MHRTVLFAVLPFCLSSLCLAGSTYVVPSTTLTAQTSNNTSAANSFTTQTNGNLGASNISKVDVNSLLYAGAATKVYAHLMLWFGESNHMNVGYSSTNPTQVQSQINDMISRGIDGVIIDWYGPGNSIDQATQLVMAAAESHPGFTFAIMIDQGAIEWDSCPGCSPQEALIAQLQYLQQTYFSSPAYMKWQGQPVVTNFDIDLSYTIDWTAVNAALSVQPIFVFQNNNGFTHVLTDGSYAWVMPTDSNFGLSYLASFYGTGMQYPSQQTIGATYKGFNDTLAAWSSDRIMSQQCGQTWLQTFSAINNLYSAAKPLPDLQLVTWNDYEEGTEIESGIANCFSLSSSVSGNSLQWTINGNENTIDHYNVYISTDGQNLMTLAQMQTGVYSLNLCSFPIPSGNYTFYVQAAGRPSMSNQISGAVQYNPSCATAAGPPAVSLNFSASPNSLTIPAGQTGNFTVTATPRSGSFNSAITLSCSGLPSGLECAFSPATITPGASAANSTLTISSSSAATKLSPVRNSNAMYAVLLLPFGIAGLAFAGGAQRRRGVQLLVLCGVMGLGIVSSSCGSGSVVGSQSAAQLASTAYSITIQGNSSGVELSTTVKVIVQ
jgi:hypothetical protein